MMTESHSATEAEGGPEKIKKVCVVTVVQEGTVESKVAVGPGAPDDRVGANDGTRQEP